MFHIHSLICLWGFSAAIRNMWGKPTAFPDTRIIFVMSETPMLHIQSFIRSSIFFAAIRNTWGNTTLFPDTRIIFVMGETPDLNVQNKLEVEAQRFHDIVQENFHDDYKSGEDRTRPDTRLPKSRAGGQGPYLKSLDHLGSSSGVKKKIIKS